MFAFKISCLTMPNLPWLMDLTFQVPMQYFSLQDWTFTTRHIHNWALSPLWASHFILSGAISNCLLLFPSIILDTFQSEGLIFWCHIFLPFHTVHGVLQRRILKWVAICFSSRPCFVRTLQVLLKPSLKDYDPSVLSDPAWHRSWLHWVMQAPSSWQGCFPQRGR